MHQNQNGSLTLSASALFLILSFFAIISLYKAQLNYFSTKNRSQTYLCYKQQKAHIYSMHRSMSFWNRSIRRGNLLIATLYPPTVKAGQMIVKAAKVGQSLIFIKEMVDYTKIITKYCKIHQSSAFTINQPYGLLLTRKFDGTAKLKKRKVNLVISNLKYNKFIIHSQIEFKNRFSKDAKYKSKEYDSLATTLLDQFI